MSEFPDDIFTEPSDLDVDTLANLGPLRPMAGRWQGVKGLDTKPVVEGTETQVFVEYYDLQPIDPQTNGPQTYCGLRYHTHIVKPGEVETYHDQVGYWLWEPATGTIIQTLAIPRAQIAMAVGQAAADAKTFELKAQRGETSFGICSAPFLEHAFRTDSYTIRVTINADGTWSYYEDTVMQVRGRDEPFHHIDRNTLIRVADPAPNPLMRG